MLIGTHTSENDNNYVQIAQVHLPKAQAELKLDQYDDERGGALPLPTSPFRCTSSPSRAYRNWRPHRYRTTRQGHPIHQPHGGSQPRALYASEPRLDRHQDGHGRGLRIRSHQAPERTDGRRVQAGYYAQGPGQGGVSFSARAVWEGRSGC